MKYLVNPLNYLKNIFRSFKAINIESVSYRPSLRIIEVEKNSYNNFIVKVQLIHKCTVLKMKPEEILADDDLTEQFSPTDIRTLTYLGYLCVNSPKYTILAKRLSNNTDQMLFAIQKKGMKKPIIKTAPEISSDEDILTQLNQRDAHMIGFTTATEQSILEAQQKHYLSGQMNAELSRVKNLADVI